MTDFQKKLSSNAALLNSQMAEILDKLEQNLSSLETAQNFPSLPPKNIKPNQNKLIQAASYAIFSGGKRIRPFLLLETLKMLFREQKAINQQINKEKLNKQTATKQEQQNNLEAKEREALQIALNIACSLEFIHTYSLIHDDLPAMDDDNFRRGKPTCHKQFDEATAILAGDALLTFAFEILSDQNLFNFNSLNLAPQNQKIDKKTESLTQNWQNNFAKTQLQIINLVAKAIGFNGMAGGQMLDLQSKNWENDLQSENLENLKAKNLKNKSQFINKKNQKIEQILHLHNLKTGKLLICAVQIAIILAKNFAVKINPEIEKKLLEYATNIGLAFQIKDDILDFFLEKKSLEPSKKAERQKKIKPKNQKLQKLDKSKFGRDDLKKTTVNLKKRKMDQNLIDEKQRTKTINIVDLLGLKQSNLKLEKLKQNSINCLRSFGDNANLLKDLSLFMSERNF